MTNKILILILAGFASACSNTLDAQSKAETPMADNKKMSAPVNIESSVPKNMKAGEQITTKIRFVALADIPELVVSAKAYSGLELVSGGNELVVTNIKRGETHDMEVTVLLKDDIGYVAVYAAVINAQGKTSYNTRSIRFGSPSAATLQKMESEHLIENSQGEQLIIMPAEDR